MKIRHSITSLALVLALASSPVLTHAQEKVGGIGASAGAIGGIATTTIVAGAVGVAVAAAVISNNRGTTSIPPSSVVDPQSKAVASISFSEGVTTVAALAGEISYATPDGKVTRIDIGTGLIIGADGKTTTQTLSSLIAAEKAAGTATGPNSVTAGLAKVVNQLSANVSAGQYGATGGALLSAVIKTAGTANPSAVTDYAKTSVAAIAANQALTSEEKAAAAAAVTEAAVAAVPPSQRAAQAAALQTVLAENASGLGLSSTEIASTVANANTAASSPASQTTDTSRSATLVTPVDTTIINVSPSA